MNLCARFVPAGLRTRLALAVLTAALCSSAFLTAGSADAYIFWTNHTSNSIARASNAGKGVIPGFISGASEPIGLALDSHHLYWANWGDGTIGRANLDGSGADETFVVTAPFPRTIAVDGQHIYWTDPEGIGRADLDGSSPEEGFIKPPGGAVSVAVDASHIYWSTSGSRAIARANLDGTGINEAFISGLHGGPLGLAVDGQHIYWAIREGIVEKFGIGRANLNGGEVDESFVTNQYTWLLALDAGHIYWTEPELRIIGRANLDGTGVNGKFITGTALAYGVAVNEEESTNTVEGTIAGVVTDTSAAHVAGASVSACSTETGCYYTETETDGSYSMSVADGTYVVSVSPPTESGDDSATSAAFAMSGTATTTENFTLKAPTPPPAGTHVESGRTTGIGGAEVPVLYWGAETPINTHACIGGTVAATITATNQSTGVSETTHPVTLTETPPGSGTFNGKLPAVYPLHGVGTVAITAANCPSSSEEVPVEFNIYIDPSGLVLDGSNGNAPLAGATVTLLSASQLAGPYAPVANGSPVMSPANRTNPDTSSAEGTFGWDTVPGFYEIQAAKPGCGRIVSPAFQVPPPQTNIQIVLHCAAGLHIEIDSLPQAQPGAAYSVQLEASGGSAPYKWKKGAKLPRGLKLSKTGLLSGTPSAKLAPGSYPISVRVQDAAKHTAAATLTLEVT